MSCLHSPHFHSVTALQSKNLHLNQPWNQHSVPSAHKTLFSPRFLFCAHTTTKPALHPPPPHPSSPELFLPYNNNKPLPKPRLHFMTSNCTSQLQTSISFYSSIRKMSSASSSDNGAVLPAAKPEKVSLTEREQEILSKAWGCMKAQPEVSCFLFSQLLYLPCPTCFLLSITLRSQPHHHAFLCTITTQPIPMSTPSTTTSYLKPINTNFPFNQIDYNKLAAETGMTNPRSASNAWSALKKKLFQGVPATPRGKKAAAAAAAATGDDDDTEATPVATASAKRKRVPASRKKAAATEGGEEGDAEVEGTPTKKKRAIPRKKATPAKVEPQTKVEVNGDAEEEKPVVKTDDTKTENTKTEDVEKNKTEEAADEI